MSLISRLPLKANRRPKIHFNVSTVLRYAGMETRTLDKEDPVKGFGEVAALTWETTEDLTDIDGTVHPAGTELEETYFVFSNDTKSQERAGSALFFAANALLGSKPAEDFQLADAADLVGRTVNTKISYQPSKDDPSNREKGFDNFRHTVAKKPAAPASV